MAACGKPAEHLVQVHLGPAGGGVEPIQPVDDEDAHREYYRAAGDSGKPDRFRCGRLSGDESTLLSSTVADRAGAPLQNCIAEVSLRQSTPVGSFRSAIIAAAFGVGALSPATVAAQQPPTRADSVAKADSIARADSILLQGELARIRGERRPVPGAQAQPSPQQRDRTPLRSPRFRVGLVVGAGTAWAEDEAGVTVGSGLIGGLSAEAGWAVGAPYTLGLGLRATTGGVSIEEDGDSRSGGSATQADFMGSVERAAGGRLGLRLAAGASWIFGPEDVVPFGDGNRGRLQPTVEAGALARLTRERPLFATLALQTTRFGGATLGDPVPEPGWVSRVLIGVRHGR